jgi:3-deoxy-D-manno-octulosonic-acid transferase
MPFVLIRLLWRSRKEPAYRKRWAERFGFFTMPAEYQHGILIHAVSVGETMAAVPLIRQLQKTYPQLPITITSMTITGSQQVQAIFEGSVFNIYIPYDLPDAVKRFLIKVQPKIAIIMETELWPNLLYYCRKQHIPVLLANARLSAKSAQGYARFGKFTASLLLRNVDCIAAQAEADAKRFIELGMPQEKVMITGSIKFDVDCSPSIKEAGELLRQQLGADRPVLIAASTHEGEEEIILQAFATIKQQFADCLLILVPRHPQRFDQVASLCRKRGFKIVLRSSDITCSTDTDIFIGDTMGELMKFYAAADIAFVGGSLVPTGGHNFLEPAMLGIPIISGKHIFNFAEISRLLKQANALELVADAEQLSSQVIRFVANVKLRQEAGERAQAVVQANRGALAKHMQLITQLCK